MYVHFAAYFKCKKCLHRGKPPIKGQYNKGQRKKIKKVNIKINYDYFGVKVSYDPFKTKRLIDILRLMEMLTDSFLQGLGLLH